MAVSKRQIFQLAFFRHSVSFSTRTPALPDSAGIASISGEWRQDLEPFLTCLVVPKISRTCNSLLRVGHTDAAETLCTFGKLSYSRILFKHEQLELLFLTGFLLCGSVSENDKIPNSQPQRAD